jgi:hypothetical protein
MADGGAEVRAPFRLPLIGVGARIDQDIDPAAAQFDRQRIRMRMRGDRQVPVRAMIAAAPDLVLALRTSA